MWGVNVGVVSTSYMSVSGYVAGNSFQDGLVILDPYQFTLQQYSIEK